MLDAVLTKLDGERQAVIDLQRLLVACPAIGPEGEGQGEKDKAEALEKHLESLGFPSPFRMRSPDPRVSCGYRPSLAYVIPGQDRSRTFWVLSHLDVVPPGDRSLWKTDPFELTVDGDILIGRGVEDNHQGVVSSFLLAKALVQQKIEPPFNLGLLFIADEENGNQHGLEFIMREHAALFKKGDLFLAPDYGAPNGDIIEVAEKSLYWLKVIVEGKQCHASTPDEGCNTLRASSDFIVRLKDLERQFDRVDPLFQPARSTFEPTKKEANVGSINIIPGRDVFYIDSRVLPTYDLDDVLNSIQKIGDGVSDDYGVTISYETVQHVQASPATSVEADIVKRLIPAIHAVYGCDPKPVGVGGGTLAAILRREGFEAAVWSALFGKRPSTK